MSQSTQTPGWGPTPTPQPPKPKRQFTITKIAIGVAAGIALFLVAVFVLIGVMLGSGNTTASKVSGATPAATEGPTSPPLDTGTSTPASTPVDETPTPAAGQVGDTVAATGSDGGGADITVTKIAVSFATIDYQTAEHGMFLIVHVKAKGTGGSFDINPLDFYVTGSDGTHYEDPTYSGTGDASALESSTLHDGEHVSGVLVYDVNPKARHGKFAYSPNLDSEPIATWKF